MKRIPAPNLQRRQGQDPINDTPLTIVNQCPEDIWPAIGTQHGNGPSTNGFKLASGEQNNLTVSSNWQGRVWGRTNCSFNDAGTGPAAGGVGRSCGSGDCNGALDCKVGGDVPVSLAEFTLDAGDGQTYYDISLVDGYNIPMAIVMQPLGNASIEDIPPNLTNPCCIATFGQLAAQNHNPYDGGKEYLGTNESYKLPLDQKVNDEQVRNWCPWNLMLNKPEPPSDGVYTYPDSSVEKPPFNPCYSACAKFNLPEDCCTGEHNQPSTCQPSEYSKNIKAVCPDAYSYAFDDQTSTFIIPSGPGFQIIFCPGGRSTTILTAEAGTVDQSSHGEVSFGGGGNASTNMMGAGAAVRECKGESDVGGMTQANVKNSYPGMRGNGKYWARSDGASGAMVGEMSSQELGLGLEMGLEHDYDEPLGGVRIVELARRGLHLMDWSGQSSSYRPSGQGKVKLSKENEMRMGFGGQKMLIGNPANGGKRSAGSLAIHEAGGRNWWLMILGLGVTASVFVLL
ncbi:Osmotin thaumatin-like protein [Venturia nashicola]|uniref:Osmotin thaumatin-like protein n=1 Tax=Venturia nashicola TaxID=86259 RepID=A0A4Z1NSD0_9PEZI|nr:Osmotin thaumatin-like protein [Venturia nashicola]TLD27466.1 Osmotin thaumatin-like protein [Venturia nashicola]